MRGVPLRAQGEATEGIAVSLITVRLQLLGEMKVTPARCAIL